MSIKGYKIVIAGGGTGGHLFPAIAIGDELISRGAEVRYVGSKYGIESKYEFINKENIELLDLKGLQRTLSIRSLLRNILLPYRIIKSFFQINRLFKKFKPDFIIGTGGYLCAIPLFLGLRKKILTAVQEQNVLPGMVTNKFSDKVDFIFTSFEESKEYLSNINKLVCLGNPIRNIIKVRDKNYARDQLDLELDKFTILIIGGSQGARSINEHFSSKYKYYLERDIQIVWQIGSNSSDAISDIDNSNIKIHKFIDDMGIAYSAADLVVSRAGATAISEIISLGKPSVLIPYPYAANNHQEVNASVVQGHNACLMMKEKELKDGKLEEFINDSSKLDLHIKRMESNALKLSNNNSAALIANKIIDEIEHVR